MTPADILALVASDADCVEVVGAGEFADELRDLAVRQVSASGTSQRPSVVIELTGNDDSIRSALHRVRDLGTIVLAGPQPSAPLALDLYSDLHVRGLTVIGLSPVSP